MSPSPRELLRHIVWDVLTNHIPALHSAVSELLDEEDS